MYKRQQLQEQVKVTMLRVSAIVEMISCHPNELMNSWVLPEICCIHCHKSMQCFSSRSHSRVRHLELQKVARYWKGKFPIPNILHNDLWSCKFWSCSSKSMVCYRTPISNNHWCCNFYIITLPLYSVGKAKALPSCLLLYSYQNQMIKTSTSLSQFSPLQCLKFEKISYIFLYSIIIILLIRNNCSTMFNKY